MHTCIMICVQKEYSKILFSRCNKDIFDSFNFNEGLTQRNIEDATFKDSFKYP